MNNSVLKEVNKIKKTIESKIKNEDFNSAIYLITVCAKILYDSNICYCDTQLENYIKIVSKKIFNNYPVNNNVKKDVVLFYDSFGLDRRGLAQIYLKAICNQYKVIYVTFDDRDNGISEIKEIIKNGNGHVRYISRKSPYVAQAYELYKIVDEFNPEKFFFYSKPSDVVAPSIMYLYRDVMTRYIINLTDHAFWLGADCIDKCIEFRDYGASVSKDHRNIPKNKIVKIPFYPLIDFNQKFNGFPFPKNNRHEVLFSGGNIYKTISKNKEYYRMIRNILDKHSNVVFWYAGSGYSKEMEKLIKDYEGRVFVTDERKDLYQVLCNCDYYISTYPICGGLMFQYAASAGIVPLTLKSNQLSDDFLLNQKSLNIEFENESKLYEEIDKLIDNKNYKKTRSNEMKKAVSSVEAFENRVRELLEGKIKNDVNYYQIDTKTIKDLYKESFTKKRIFIDYVEFEHIGVSLKNSFFKTIIGLFFGLISFIKMRIIRGK